MKLLERFKALKMQLAIEIAKQPQEIKRTRKNIIVRTIIVDFLFSVFAFSIKGAQFAIENDFPIIAILFLVIYFSERVVESAYQTYADLQEDNFRQLYTAVITKRVMMVGCYTQGRVFKKDQFGNSSLMQHPEIIKKSKDYIDGVWQFWWNVPVTASNIVTLIVMISVTLSMELTSGTGKETVFTMSLLIICIIIYFILGKKRIEVMKAYRRLRRENEAKEEVLFSEIKSIEFASVKDFLYHTGRFKEHLVSSKELLAKERLKLNATFLKRSAVASFFMIAILVYKIMVGNAINEEVFFGIVGVSTVYSTILNKISDILGYIENTVNYMIDIDKLYPDFANIYNVYCKECEAEKVLQLRENEQYKPKAITVDEFVFSYDMQNTWKLVNQHPFDMQIGETILVEGETGSGKTTGLNIFSGSIRMQNSPIILDNGTKGYLRTLTYHTDRAMANNFILNEIILSDDFSLLDRSKLMEILEGIQLKEVFLKRAKRYDELKGINDEEELIIEYMKRKTYKQFSSGQQQRLALAKLLYTLDEKSEAIWLDEAFNRLNDEVADKCVRFILDFTQRDRNRLILIATHQLNIIRKYCSKEISFVQTDNGSIISFKQV